MSKNPSNTCNIMGLDGVWDEPDSQFIEFSFDEWVILDVIKAKSGLEVKVDLGEATIGSWGGEIFVDTVRVGWEGGVVQYDRKIGV